MTEVKTPVWPDRLMIRDTGLYDDMGGGGQRIYTTAGRGYERKEYVRADIARATAPPDDPYAALSQHLHGDGDTPPLRITYRNWRGEVSERNIVPQSVWFGATEWHPDPQWLLSALDTEKGAARDFALADFGANDDTWRTRALAAETEVERLRAATPERDAEVRRAALEDAFAAIDEYPRAAPSADEWMRYDEQIEFSQGIIRTLIDATPTPACATPGCSTPAVIRLDDRRLCRDCYATHDFGDDA